MTGQPAIGIDLGGTKIQAGVVTADGQTLGQVRRPTDADKDCETVLANMVDSARRAAREAGCDLEDIAGIGVGSPAPLDIFHGVIISPGNLPSLHGFPIVSRLSEALGRPVALNNDANCFGLAEARFGAGAGAQVCCGLTLGTGLGGFLVIGGELFNGPRGAAAEIWCCPYQGDQVEEKVSGRGVARNYKKLTERVATAEEIASLARSGDGNAREAWREFGRDLAVPVAYMCNIADPDVLVLGGSMIKAWDLFREAMFEEAMKYVNAVTREAVRIVPGKLGDAAGMLGAAALILGKRLGL
ncbi:MAG: ROK family protein [Candidatus Brocadiae bacterium]|nr:ROK family protein [Candidatus Brocadiia bacterium]